MFRETYIEVDLDCIKYNANFFKNNSKKSIIGVLKANGYGTIDYIEAEALKEAGVDFFAVSSLDEALRLRNHGIDDKILILGYVPETSMNLIRNNNLSIVTLSKDFVMKADLKDVNVHIKIDTGMNRIGIEPDEAKEVYDLLSEKGANIEGIMSHFSSADSDAAYSLKQYEMFKNVVTSLQHDFSYIHMNATDAAIILKDDICNAQRIGLGLLGFSSYDVPLKPAVRLYSEVTMVKKLAEGETVSYGRHYTSDGKGYILTLPIGYADGFFRANTGKPVYIEKEYGTIVGSICMDQLMVHTEKYYRTGTKVELFGDHIDIKQRANDLDTIIYELLTNLSGRLSRVFIKDGMIYKTIDQRL
ncbi:MAG: alanine racemase [Erysipelotrichaceae bacterium]|nr:alanine racemase [Erysipelotrichaceae bacterium]